MEIFFLINARGIAPNKKIDYKLKILGKQIPVKSALKATEAKEEIQ